MGKTKIVLNRAGVRELMQSPEMQAILVEHANKIASASDTEAIIELDDISRCELNTDYNYTDTARKKYRYQAVYDIVHY